MTSSTEPTVSGRHIIEVQFVLTGEGDRPKSLAEIQERIKANLLEEFGADSELHGYSGPTISSDQLWIKAYR